MSIFDFFHKKQTIPPHTCETIKRQMQILTESVNLVNDSCDVQTVLKQYDITCQTLEHLLKYTDEEMQAAGFKTLGSLSESFSNILANKESIINQAIQRNFDKKIDSLTTTDEKAKALDTLYNSIRIMEGLDSVNISFLDALYQERKNNLCITIQFGQFTPLPNEQFKTQTGLDIESEEYVQLSTSGDENVCPMCAQFEGKIFPVNDAPKLPLCPSCACAYMYYYKNDLPSNAVISHKNDFILPSKHTPLFYKHQQSIYNEPDINKQIRLCENDLNKLSEFMTPYINANFNAPQELVCRDLLPELYMRLGKWDKAEKAIKRCIEANAYYPDNGSEELLYLTTFRKVATQAISYITQNPGCLQRNIYKALPYEADEKECLKHFLRNSLLITKEKFNNTNKLYIPKA